MRFLFKLIFSFVLVFVNSCSSEDNSDNSNYNYQAKLVFHNTLDASCYLPSNLPIHKKWSYTLDTLNIDMTCTLVGGVIINAQAFETLTSPSNETVHIKHLNFINLNPTNSAQEVNSIHLSEDIFTYSTSNVDLQTMPNLFNDNSFTNHIVHPEQIDISDRHPNYITNLTSSEVYPIGSEQVINGIAYEILSVN